jgi:hypothetical protein
MKTALKYVLPVGLMLASACAMASDRLTPHQCNSYPFMPTNGEVTHRDLMRELTELEAATGRASTTIRSTLLTHAHGLWRNTLRTANQISMRRAFRRRIAEFCNVWVRATIGTALKPPL